MSVKAGKILTLGNGFLIDRLQTTGPGSLNIPTEKIHETGNELAVATIRDVPDLSFDLESLDTTVEAEAILCNVDETTLDDGDFLTFLDAKPLDIVSPYKAAGTSKTSVRGVIVPQLYLESASYKFGVKASATQTFSLKGDSQYSVPGTPYRETRTGSTAAAFTLAHTAIKVVEKGEDIFALSVCLYHSDGTYTRLFHGTDYTDTSTTVTLTVAPLTTDTLAVCYGSLTAATFAQTIHPTPSVKPGAVRGKDIDLYVGISPIVDPEAPPAMIRWAGVQSVDLDWKVTLDEDDELGNAHHVSSDYDVPDVTGSVTMRPVSIEYLFARIAQVSNVPLNEVAGLLTSSPLELQVRISHPETGARLKTFRIPDARIEPPAIQAKVNSKIEPQFPFTSDAGILEIYKGAPA